MRLYLGMLAATVGEHQLADQHLGYACEFHERAGMPTWAALSQQRWAEALASRGDTQAARQHAERAHAMAGELGYAEVERRSRELIEGPISAAT